MTRHACLLALLLIVSTGCVAENAPVVHPSTDPAGTPAPLPPASENPPGPPTTTLKDTLGGCYNPSTGGEIAEDIRVNGYSLTAAQARNVAWIRRCVMPLLPGTPDDQARVAAHTTWWTLREGILDLSGAAALRYSNCHENGVDTPRSGFPLYLCPTTLWQVGLAAGQVFNYSDAAVAAVRHQVYDRYGSQADEASLLAWTANLAGFSESDPVHSEIVNATGAVRRSWLLRNPAIGFLLVEKQEVVAECLTDKKSWCFGSGYAAAARYSSNEAAMLQTISDLHAYFSSGT